jgi:hypothetical protein
MFNGVNPWIVGAVLVAGAFAARSIMDWAVYRIRFIMRREYDLPLAEAKEAVSVEAKMYFLRPLHGLFVPLREVNTAVLPWNQTIQTAVAPHVRSLEDIISRYSSMDMSTMRPDEAANVLKNLNAELDRIPAMSERLYWKKYWQFDHLQDLFLVAAFSSIAWAYLLMCFVHQW